MAHLAIKGHATRGYEVIEILEMLGGEREGVFSGNIIDAGYYIDSKGYIDYGYANFLDNIVIYTLDEFLEKFPYKVGDKVVYENKKREITKMGWEERINTVAYKLDDKLYCNVIAELQPYKEENMEEITDKAKSPVLTGEDLAYNRFGYKIPNGYEFDCIKNNEIIIKPKQPQYPKTYEECCALLSLGEDGRLYTKGYKARLIQDFQKLLVCRDAYWKIAGEQMGLGKSWEPDFGNDLLKYYISFHNNKIDKGVINYSNKILAFPTAEMRDAFYENFKELINVIKELL